MPYPPSNIHIYSLLFISYFVNALTKISISTILHFLRSRKPIRCLHPTLVIATMITEQKPRVSTESYAGVHPDVQVIDFATQNKVASPKLERKRSLRRRIIHLVWNPKAKHLRRGILMKLLQEDPDAVEKRRMSLT